MKVRRINPNIGASVSGVDITQFTLADREELLALLDEHLALIFSGQSLTQQQLLDFGSIVGTVQSPDEALLPQLKVNERIQYVDVSGTTRGTYADVWHTDVSCLERPTYAAILQPQVLPSMGGDTLWASMYAAYEALDEPVRSMIEDMRAVHEIVFDGNCLTHSHPLVRVNPRTGRRALYVNQLFTKRIEGLAPIENAKLLHMLLMHCALPEFQVRYRWTPDSVVLWDNRFVLHYAVRDYTEPRQMIRTSTWGERPIGPKEYDAMREKVAA
jgi:taurine dioxygenase